MKIRFGRGGFRGGGQGRSKCGNARGYALYQNEYAEKVCTIPDGRRLPDQPWLPLAAIDPVGEMLANDRRVLPDKEHPLSKPVMTFLSHRGLIAFRLF